VRKPVAIDLFSGCGGLTLGLKQAGFRVIGAVEIDPLAVKTYKANHKRVHIWQKDIRYLPGSAVAQKLNLKPGELHLLAGCPPCEGFSTLTTLNRRVRKDPRNELVFEYLRFVRVLRPKALMMENVPGLAKNWRFSVLRKKLKQLGYVPNDAILNAADYGVPQRRRRLILLAGNGQKIPFGRRSRRIRTVRQTIGRLGPRIHADPLHNVPEKRTAKVKEKIRLIPRNGGSRSDLGRTYRLPCHKECDGFKDVYGRMSWDDVSPTITGGCCNPSKGRFLHPTRNRTITLREAALLQTFPPSYVFSLTEGKFRVAEMIGNALPPEFIRRNALAIRRTFPKLAAA
jgi:DNA (cytosine-5)-methyltransferase 1